MSPFVTFAPTLLLYLGAVLAGWGGAGGVAVLVPLWLAFVLWHVVMRPAEWPRDFAAWTAAVAVRAGISGVVLLLLAGACLMLGRGLSLWLPLAVPIWTGPLVALLATPLQRMVHNPTAAAGIETFLDDALAQIGGQTGTLGKDIPGLRAALLQGQTDLNALSRQHGPAALLDMLVILQDEGRLSQPLAKALIGWACDPVQSQDLQGLEAAYVTLTLVQDDAALVAEFAQACIALLRAEPEAYWDCPSNRMLRQVQQRHAGRAAEQALRALRKEQLCVTRDRLARSRAELLALMQESADNPAP